MRIEKYKFILLLICLTSLSSLAYDSSRLNYEMELLEQEAFQDTEAENPSLTTKQKQRIRLSQKTESKIVNLESKYFEAKDKNSSAFEQMSDEVNTMNAAPLKSENAKKRGR